ncbi:hypothetical protein ACKKBF_B36060 [Auxenochlorella protothecoides x Auxenochlorella symbiontica]
MRCSRGTELYFVVYMLQARLAKSGGGRRVCAPLLPTSGCLPLPECVRGREVGLGDSGWLAELSIAKLSPQDAWDVHAAHTEWPPLHLRRRAAIAEVVLAGSLTIATSQNGVAVAFSEGSKEGCVLNLAADEHIHGISAVSGRPGITVISSFLSDGGQSLRCRVVSLAGVLRGTPHDWMPLWTNEPLHNPGFIELSDGGAHALVFDPAKGQYSVWDVGSRSVIFGFASAGVVDAVFASEDAVLCIRPSPAGGTQRLTLLALVDGSSMHDTVVPGPACPTRRHEVNGPWLFMHGADGVLRTQCILRQGAPRPLRAAPAPDLGDPLAPPTLLHAPRLRPGRVLLMTGDTSSRTWAEVWDAPGRLRARFLLAGPPAAGEEAGAPPGGPATAYLCEAQASALVLGRGGRGACLHVIDLASLTRGCVLEGHAKTLGPVTALCLDEAGGRLATGDARGHVHLWT